MCIPPLDLDPPLRHRLLTGPTAGSDSSKERRGIEVRVAHRRAQYDESCRLCSGGSGCTCTTLCDIICRRGPKAPKDKRPLLVENPKESCMKRLLTLWRMSAVRVRLPPAVENENFVDVDKSL